MKPAESRWSWTLVDERFRSILFTKKAYRYIKNFLRYHKATQKLSNQAHQLLQSRKVHMVSTNRAGRQSVTMLWESSHRAGRPAVQRWGKHCIVRANCKDLPSEFTQQSWKLHSPIQGFNAKGKALLLSSKVKKTKIVNILSTVHHLETNLCQDNSRNPM